MFVCHVCVDEVYWLFAMYVNMGFVYLLLAELL